MNPAITGAVFEKWRIKRNLIQKEISDRSGLSFSVVGSLLRGTRLPENEEFVLMCQALRVSLFEVFSEFCHAQLQDLRRTEAELLAQRGEEPSESADPSPSVAEMQETFSSVLEGLQKLALPLFPVFRHLLEQSGQAAWLQVDLLPAPAEPEPPPEPRRARSRPRKSS